MQPRKTVVIGAGTVGVCAALYLQRDGHAVGLIDRNEPGTGCSYGNAGVVQVTACVPIATPGVLRDVPRMLLSKDQPLVIRWQYLPWLAPYLLRFINAARPSEVERISQALTRILVLAKDSYAPLIAAAGAADLIKPTGELHVYETEAAYRKARFGHDLRRARGLRIEDIGPVQISEIEPSLAPIFRHAIYLPDPVQTVSPYLFTRKLAESFVRAGGDLVQESVEDILLGPEGVTHVVTGQSRRPAPELVLATGAHSKRWAAKLGSYVPLDSERGYHLTLPDPGVELRVPVISGDYRFGIASMTEGLRLAGTAELARLDAKPNYTRAQRLVRLAQRLLPKLNPEGAKPWMGQRPSTPDSMPVIGRSPHVPHVYFAFGHGHLGLTLAAATGRVVADLVASRPVPIDISDFSISRFRKFGFRQS
jgi:D-amino-acid dehydrogenase